MRRGKPPTPQEVEEARAGVFLDQVRTTLQGGEFKSQEQLVARLLEEGFTSTDIASALLHMLQSGQGASGVKTHREEPVSRADRPPRNEGYREREERPFRNEFERPRQPAREGFRPVQPRPRADTAPVGKVKTHASVVSTQLRPARPVAHPPAVVSEGTSSKPLAPSPSLPERRESHPKADVFAPKASRRTPAEQTRIYMNVGSAMGIAAGDVVGTILGETGLPATVVGAIDIRERHLFVDVAADYARAIISKLNRTRMRGNKLKVKVA
jgi:ATP-dependent RNA helicase DeaD